MSDERERLAYMRVAPESLVGLRATEHYLNTVSGLGGVLLELVRLRASQMNDCHFCLGLHRHELLLRGQTESWIAAVAQWRESEAFNARERAALRWTEVLTDIQDGHAADEEFAAVREHFSDKELVELTVAVSAMNAWNRVAIAFRPQWDAARATRRAPAVDARTSGAEGA